MPPKNRKPSIQSQKIDTSGSSLFSEMEHEEFSKLICTNETSIKKIEDAHQKKEAQ